MENENKLIAKWIGWCVLGIVVLIVLFGSVGTVGAGERGVKTLFSNVIGEVQPGLYFKLPLIEGVHKTDIQTQKVQQDTTAASSDLQDVKATIAVNFKSQVQNPEYTAEFAKACIDLDISSRKEKKA